MKINKPHIFKLLTYFWFLFSSTFFIVMMDDQGKHIAVKMQYAQTTGNKQSCSLFLPDAMVHTVGDMNMFCWSQNINISQVN